MKYLMIVLLFLFSCSLKKSKNAKFDKDMININIDSLPRDNKLMYSSIFKGYKVIPLETSSNCYIGQIDQIYIADDKFFVLDSRIAKSVFVFSKTGEFIVKIGKIGKGPGEYLAPSAFKVNEKNDEIYILDRNLQSIFRYDFTGKFLEKIKIAGDKAHDFILNDKGKIFINSEIFRKGSHKYLLREISFNGKELNKWFPTPKYGKSWSYPISTQSFFSTSQNIKFYEPYLDTVYSIDPDKIKAYLCLTSVNLATEDDIIKYESEKKNKTSMRYDYSDFNKIWGPTDYFEDDNLVFLVLMNNSLPYFIAYNKSNRKSLASYWYNFDDDLAFTSHLSPPFVGVYNSEFIKVVRPEQIEEFKTKISQNTTLSKDMIDLVSNLTNQSNPILILYETKKE